MQVDFITYAHSIPPANMHSDWNKATVNMAKTVLTGRVQVGRMATVDLKPPTNESIVTYPLSGVKSKNSKVDALNEWFWEHN